jgi:hypothetical protein
MQKDKAFPQLPGHRNAATFALNARIRALSACSEYYWQILVNAGIRLSRGRPEKHFKLRRRVYL